jgi:uncharacterized damage-inducible protein DinB
MPTGESPKAPDNWDAILAALESPHHDFGDVVGAMPDEQPMETVNFFTGPRTLSDDTCMEVAWFLRHDEIHHRGQFSVYLRMADGVVLSISGPTAHEPWM